MSIYAYTGLPGSGKSYSTVVNQILPALRDDRIVVTNVPVYEDRLRELTTLGEIRELPLDKIAQEPGTIFEYAPPGCVLIIDELWKLFPAGQKVNNVPQPFKELLAEHRHMVDAKGRATQIVFVTQDLAQIAMFARLLVEQTFHHVQLGSVGMRGRYQVCIYQGSVTGQTPPTSRQINKMMGRYEERFYRLYKSNTMSQAQSDGAMEAAIDTRGNAWKRPGVIISFSAAAMLLVWGATTLASVLGDDEENHQVKPAAVVTSPRGQRATSLQAERQAEHQAKSRAWRVSMVLTASDPSQGFAVLEDGSGEIVRLPIESCRYDRRTWMCRHEGRYWALSSQRRPPPVDTRPMFPSVPVADAAPAS